MGAMFFFLILAALIGAGVLNGSMQERAQLKGILDGLRTDADVELGGISGSLAIQTRRPHRMATLTSTAPHFDGISDAPFTGAVSWLYLTRWRHPDPLVIGDVELDSLVAVSAGAPEVAKQMLLEPRVRTAIIELFARSGARAMHLDTNGRLFIRFARLPNASDAKRQVLTLAELAAALEATPAARALPRPELGDIEALGGASGAPVGVPGRR
jgi:hypothetical protein